MKSFLRPLGVSVLLGYASVAWAQEAAGPKIDRVDVKFVGPDVVSEDYIRANIKLKAGDTYLPGITQDDVHSLYGTGQFYNIQISVTQADDGGVVLTYIVQARPRITEVKVVGNSDLTYNKVMKKITVKVGEPLDEQKLFTDVQEIKKLYEKYGLADTQVKYVLNIDEATGHGTVTFQIIEAHKVKITEVDFLGATAFPQSELRKEVKTRRRWFFSWITGSGFFKQDDFDADPDALAEFYRDHGYLDFQINDVKIEHPTPKTIVVKYYVFEGKQYKVGSVKVTGNKIFTDAQITAGLRYIHSYEHQKGSVGTNGMPMDVGDTFTPDGLTKDVTAVEDFYGSRGYVDISQGQALHIIRVPNVDTGTMDIEFHLDDSQKDYIQKVEIRGNLKTKDKVIRRELAIAPGEVLDMVRIKISQQRLEDMKYFSKVEISPEPTDPVIPGKKDVVVNVDEQNTGNFTVGAGFSSVESLFGYVEVSQGNFDLFKPPYFTGAGEKIKLRVEIGLKEQNYDLNFIEPWFLDRKLALGVDIYRHELYYESPNNIFGETRTGAKVSLTRALGSDFLIGSVYDTIEQVGISLNGGWNAYGSGAPGDTTISPGGSSPQLPNTPADILSEVGVHVFERIGGSLAYDTRNSSELPNHGQRTELTGEVSSELSDGSAEFYKLELTTAWYFPGFFHGHVLEVGGRAGVAHSFSGADVPFYDRYYLGGLYSMRGYKFRNVSPRDPNYGNPQYPDMANEPIGGDNYWFGSAEYSLPIFEKDGGVSLRFAVFYDTGAVGNPNYHFSTDYDDDFGAGIRLNIPHLGPLRLDYGVPIKHDKYNGSSGQFQFGVGYERPF